MIRKSFVSFVALWGVWACSGSAGTIEGDGGEDGTTHDAHTQDAAGSDAPEDGGGPSTCAGTAPNCFGSDDSQCCGADPTGLATCQDSAWMCGDVKAPGCNGTSCSVGEGGHDSGPGDDGASDVIASETGSDVIVSEGGSDVIFSDGGGDVILYDGGLYDGGLPDGFSFDGPVPDGYTACGPTPCVPGSSCVITRTTGGPCLAPNDAGVCPPPTIKEGVCCTFVTINFACHPTPAGCGGTLSCGCASSLCDFCSCKGASGNDLDCECLGP